MGLKRLIKKVSFGGGSLIHGHIYDAIEKKNRTGKAFKECLKESIKETFSEDLPGASHLYQMGKTEGKVEGTVEQAARDEKKMQDLHDKHESDRKKWHEIDNKKDELINNLYRDRE